MEPNWHVTAKEKPFIDAIVTRAAELFPERNRTDIAMDIVATHNHACRLRLADLLAADDFNFAHDIAGIGKHLNRETLRLTNCFWPRFNRWLNPI
jgi:hypothetical protein